MLSEAKNERFVEIYALSDSGKVVQDQWKLGCVRDLRSEVR